VSFLFLVALVLAKPTGQESVVAGIPESIQGPLFGGRITLSLDVAMAAVDGIPMSRARSVQVDMALDVAESQTHTLHWVQLNPGGCRYRLPLAGPWSADARVEVRVVLTGDALPMRLVPHLPEGAVQAEDAWILTAPTGDLVLDLPACG
jgi:hypothetical protein